MRPDHITLESMSQAFWYNQWTLNKFKPFLKGTILEVGCGIGNFTKSLVNYGNVWGIDIDKINLAKNKNIFTQGHRTKFKQIGFGDIEKGKYFFGNKKFDCIVCMNVLEHIKDDQGSLENMHNLLKRDGTLILLVPAHQFLFGTIDQNIGHYRRYNKQRISQLLKTTGFEIMQMRTINFLGGLGWFLSGKVLKDSAINLSRINIFNIISPFILPLENIIEPPIGTSILVVARNRR